MTDSLIIDTIPALAWSVRPDGSAEFLNQQYLDFIGLSADQTVDWNWTSAVHPDDLAGLAATWQRILACGAPAEAEARLRRHDGQYRWFLVRANPLRDEKGNIVKWCGVNTDIDDRKRAEAELRRSYDSFAEAQRLSRTGSFTADIVAEEHVWSDELYRICEFDPGTKITTDWAREYIHPEDQPSFDAEFARSLGGADFDLTFRILTRSGKVKHLRSVAHLIDRVEGRPLFIGAIQDVTDRTIAEEALAKSEREFRLLVETIPALVWRGTSEGELDYLNQRAVEYLGHTLESVSGGRWRELVHPDHRDATVRRWLQSISTGSSYEDVYQLRRADGEFRWIQSFGEPFYDTDGRITHWYGLVIDIEDRKRAEIELRRAYDSFNDAQRLSKTGSFITDLLGDDHNWSEEAYRIFEFDPGTKVTVQRIREVIHPDDVPAFESVIARGMTGENVTFTFRVVTARAMKHVRGVAHVTEKVAGRPMFVGALQDVTESVAAEVALRALKDQLYKENLVLRDEVDRTSMFEEIVGTSPALRPVLARVAKVAPTDSTVLITGETGTGKELVARAIHRRSARGSRAFVSVNCAAMPRELIASELFGHEKGAFTGATQRRLGRFELAHGGTIFLDEVGELPMETQVALLRVLQEREFERVGGSASIRVDVRVVTATNRDLQAAVEAGTFRSDLFYRLNVFPIEVPALRERADDIPLLVEYFIDRYARKAGKTLRRINKRTLDRLRSYPWPGNVRELQNVIERSMIVCDTDEFTVDESWLSARPAIDGPLALSRTVGAQEKGLIEEALRACGGRVYGPAGAAARLGIPRSTLESKIRALKISKNRFRT